MYRETTTGAVRFVGISKNVSCSEKGTLLFVSILTNVTVGMQLPTTEQFGAMSAYLAGQLFVYFRRRWLALKMC